MAHLSILRDAGYAVDIATNGQEALTKFSKNHKYDIVLTDSNMPGMTGSEVAQKLLKQRSKKPFIVIAITSDPTPEVKKTCFASGINAVMKKPLVLNELLEVLGSQN